MTGIGVMLRQLAGREGSAEALEASIGKTIDNVNIYEDELTVRMKDGSAVRFKDEGQSCCEHRYMRTDDDLHEFEGSAFIGAEVVDAPDVEDAGEVHEVQFLRIHTSEGVITVSNHNEHNGYYGGFSIEARVIPAP